MTLINGEVCHTIAFSVCELSNQIDYLSGIYKICIASGNDGMVKELIKMGMPVNCHQGISPMDIAASSRNFSRAVIVFLSFIHC